MSMSDRETTIGNGGVEDELSLPKGIYLLLQSIFFLKPLMNIIHFFFIIIFIKRLSLSSLQKCYHPTLLVQKIPAIY